GFTMLRHLAKRIFGRSSGSVRLPPLSDLPPAGSPSANDGKERTPWGTVGPTEQRLRAANKQAWITSTKGWSDILGRFSSGSKD
ncbi:MAG TPA: hypothetical protein VFT21_12855, partial [Gemmatimonadaceae bacterium]|nr:hypothetical protein [Gemmatimonadaceae bacterium]